MDKPKRGRPRTNGLKPAWTFYRALLIIEGYQQSRLDAKTHRDAVLRSVAYVKQQQPNMRVSPREVDRVLAKYHSKLRCASLTVGRELIVDPVLSLVTGDHAPKEVLMFGWDERPKYTKRKRKLPSLNFSKKFK